MKKKLLGFAMLGICLLYFTACGKTKMNLNDYIIEERNNLFTAQDELYYATLSTGLREENYCLDGVKNNMIDFGILSFSKINKDPLANDNYNYTVLINEESFTGTLEKSNYDNTYSADIGVSVPNDANIIVQISFTGYTFEQTLQCTSNEFTISKSDAIAIAQKSLKTELDNMTSDKNTKIEAVTKIVKDYSSESKNLFWYVGVISTNGETLGILIDAKNGDVVAKKV
ncbi:MAG: hypothetical protein E7374_01640 [Clostridiales bacterium]|nr:hypothetical protein [Clostridiales bacterium]